MSDDSDDICRWCLKRKGEHIPHGWHFMCPPHVGSSTKYEPVQQFSKPTQRAPVEQGPSVLTEAQADRYAAFDDWYDAALKRHKRDELPFSQRAACDYAFEAGMAAAPDHAQEGALLEALELAKGALANGSTIDQRYETYKIVCAALADGKEGQ